MTYIERGSPYGRAQAIQKITGQSPRSDSSSRDHEVRRLTTERPVTPGHRTAPTINPEVFRQRAAFAVGRFAVPCTVIFTGDPKNRYRLAKAPLEEDNYVVLTPLDGAPPVNFREVKVTELTRVG